MTTTKPLTPHARCAACSNPSVPVVRGAYAAHRRPRPHSWGGATEACPNNRKPVTDEAIAKWVAWEANNARNAAEHSAKELAAARVALERAERADAEARARLAAITALAAERAAREVTQ